MTQTATHGIEVSIGDQRSVVPARFAFALDHELRPVPGAEVHEISVAAGVGAAFGEVAGWPGLPVAVLGVAEVAEGPVLVAVPTYGGGAAVPGDSYRVGPLVEMPAADR